MNLKASCVTAKGYDGSFEFWRLLVAWNVAGRISKIIWKAFHRNERGIFSTTWNGAHSHKKLTCKKVGKCRALYFQRFKKNDYESKRKFVFRCKIILIANQRAQRFVQDWSFLAKYYMFQLPHFLVSLGKKGTDHSCNKNTNYFI